VAGQRDGSAADQPEHRRDVRRVVLEREQLRGPGVVPGAQQVTAPPAALLAVVVDRVRDAEQEVAAGAEPA
jgi:hypothetical protein